MGNKKKPVRASPPKSALARLYCIDRKIASGTYPDTSHLIDYLLDTWGEVSVSTVGRDIAFMRDRLNAPVEYDALHRGYYYSKPNYRIPLGFSGADELLALGMARNILALYRNTPFYETAQQLLESITAPLAAEADSNWFEDRIVIPQIPAANIPQDVWNPVITALRENRTLTFDYLADIDTHDKPRRVRPYQLLFDNGLWFLYGYSEDEKGIRVYSLCRIKNTALTKDHFSLPKDFDYRTGTAGSYFGIFRGQKKYRFKIAIYDESVNWVQERTWTDDQKITEIDGGLIITFSSTQLQKVLEWVLSLGATAVPLSPKPLVNAWRIIAELMFKNSSLQEK